MRSACARFRLAALAVASFATLSGAPPVLAQDSIQSALEEAYRQGYEAGYADGLKGGGRASNLPIYVPLPGGDADSDADSDAPAPLPAGAAEWWEFGPPGGGAMPPGQENTAPSVGFQ